MERKPIDIKDFTIKGYSFFEIDWLLLSSGDFTAGEYNAMTISWGSLGVMWNRPFVQVVVRPHRYTYQFMERYPTFTLCAFPKSHHAALSLLGTKSGRDGNKIAEAGLTPTAASCVQAPAYVEACLVLECRKMYWQDFDPQHFLDPSIARNYPTQDYHRIYFGEILAVQGTDAYQPAGR
jgi:flavin reductase (DIM6/NTAB) family NADH-FMN oxidoreductase RutF